MTDTLGYATHAQAAATQLQALCDERVARGVAWLNENAPKDWRLQMTSCMNGQVTPRFNMAYDTENVLALAFRTERECTRPDGRVTVSSVKESGLRLGIPNGNDFHPWLYERGFDYQHLVIEGTEITSKTCEEFLAAAWKRQLLNWEWHEFPTGQ